MNRRHWAVIALATVVFGSAVAVVYSEHLSRTRLVRLERLKDQRDELNVEWGRLQLEQSTWATHGRIERIARERLNMITPPPEAVVTVRP